MTRAETYDDLAKLEQLLDEYYQVETLDPSKLPAIRVRIWETLRDAELHRDLGVEEQPEEFSDFLTHVDGYLCEIKDLPIRGGLHILGEDPRGRAPAPPPRLDPAPRRRRSPRPAPRRQRTPSASTRGSMSENGGTKVEAPPAARRTLPRYGGNGLGSARQAGGGDSRLCSSRWRSAAGRRSAAGAVCEEVLGFADTGVERLFALRGRGGRAAPRCGRRRRWGTCSPVSGAGTCLRDLPGPRRAGWSTCCPPGATSTPWTRRRCLRRLSWEVGQGLADDLLRRYLEEEGRYPESGRDRGVGHGGHADPGRRRRGDTCPARRETRLERGVAAGDGPRGDPAGRARTSEDRRNGQDQRLLQGRFSEPDLPPRRRLRDGRRPRRARRHELRQKARRRREERGRGRTPLDHAHLRLQARRLRRRSAPPDGRPQLAHRRGPRRGLRRLGRLRLR